MTLSGGGLLDFGQRLFAGLQDAGAALNGGRGGAVNALFASRGQGGEASDPSFAQRLFAGLQDAGAALGSGPSGAPPQLRMAQHRGPTGGGGLLDQGAAEDIDYLRREREERERLARAILHNLPNAHKYYV